MLALFRRHLILTLSCLFCIGLILLGWLLRTDVGAGRAQEAAPGDRPRVEEPSPPAE